MKKMELDIFKILVELLVLQNEDIKFVKILYYLSIF